MKEINFNKTLLEYYHTNNCWDRILSLYIVPKKLWLCSLTPKNPILALGLARMLISHANYKIEGKILFLRTKTLEDEIILFKKLDQTLKDWKPEVMITYGQTHRELQLLAIKKRYFDTFAIQLPMVHQLLEKYNHIDLEPLTKAVIKKIAYKTHLPLSMAIHDPYFDGIAFTYNIELQSLGLVQKHKILHKWWQDENKHQLKDFLRRETNNQLLAALQICAPGFLEIFRRHSKLVYTSPEPESQTKKKKKTTRYQTTIFDEMMKVNHGQAE